ALLQRLPLEILHGDEGLAFVLTDLVNRADVGMIECRGGTRFTSKAFQRLGVHGKTFGQELQCHEAAEFTVLGFVDHTHPAATQLLQDGIVRTLFPYNDWEDPPACTTIP